MGNPKKKDFLERCLDSKRTRNECILDINSLSSCARKDDLFKAIDYVESSHESDLIFKNTHFPSCVRNIF